MELARHLNIPIEAERFTRNALYVSNEIFLSGTAAEITPVREIDGHAIGSGARGPVTEKIQSAYFKAVRGELEGFEAWTTPYEVSSAPSA